jgi:chromosomal replication initiator protein
VDNEGIMAEKSGYELIWDEAMSQIRSNLAEEELLTCFNLEFQNVDENAFTAAVPSEFFMLMVQKRYQSLIEGKLEELTGKKITLRLLVKPKNPGEAPETAVQSPENSNSQPEKAVSAAPSSISSSKDLPASNAAPVVPEKKLNHPQLREDFTFEKYVVGEKNRFAASIANSIARDPGSNYNPFLIFGGTGLGKTHLMQAIGNYIHQNSDLKLMYVIAETFTNEFISTISNLKAKTAFKEKYRYSTDVLLIDDIQFFQSKGDTQEEFFHTFEALSNARKQMVFTCDRPVSELKKFHERLMTRISNGIIIELQMPSYETRYAIIKKKSEVMGIDFPNEVIDLLSKNILTNVRDIERAVTTLSAYATLLNRPITVEETQEKLRDLLFSSSKQSNFSIETIQRVIAEEFHLSINDLKGKRKTQNVVYPRQLAMHITREITEYTHEEIGQAFGGRDHSTVMHAIQKIESKIKAEPSMESLIQSLIRSIKDYSTKS